MDSDVKALSRSLEQVSTSNDLQRNLYIECIQRQLEEFDFLSSIFCSPGEIHIYDPTVISDFHDYIKGSLDTLRMHLDFGLFVQNSNSEKIEIRIEIPHLYPSIENAIVTIRSALLPKDREANVKSQIELFISSMDKSEGYIFQVVTWIQEHLDEFLQKTNESGEQDKNDIEKNYKNVELERVWIYSHHIKSKTKRQEILKNAQQLDLTGFIRPGKPGVICIEGLKENTQEFWKIIKAMRWQKITIKKIESKHKLSSEMEKWRRFPQFKEELFVDIGDKEDVQMNMGLFMKFLDSHNCGYMKKELFGFD